MSKRKTHRLRCLMYGFVLACAFGHWFNGVVRRAGISHDAKTWGPEDREKLKNQMLAEKPFTFF